MKEVKMQGFNPKSYRSQVKPGNRSPFRSTKPNLTMPDQAMSVKEIMRRTAAGIPVGDQYKTPVYHGEETFFPDPKTLDLVDIDNIKEEAIAKQAEIKQALRDAKTLQTAKRLQKIKEEAEASAKTKKPKDEA